MRWTSSGRGTARPGRGLARLGRAEGARPGSDVCGRAGLRRCCRAGGVEVVAALLPWVEIALGVLLLLGVGTRLAAVASRRAAAGVHRRRDAGMGPWAVDRLRLLRRRRCGRSRRDGLRGGAAAGHRFHRAGGVAGRAAAHVVRVGLAPGSTTGHRYGKKELTWAERRGTRSGAGRSAAAQRLAAAGIQVPPRRAPTGRRSSWPPCWRWRWWSGWRCGLVRDSAAHRSPRPTPRRRPARWSRWAPARWWSTSTRTTSARSASASRSATART